VSINRFLARVSKQGGMSFANNFIVRFENFPAPSSFQSYTDAEFQEKIEFFCDEAQLPNVNTATGTQNGVYLGVGSVDYPHTRIFTEFQLGFMLDADLSVLKFLNRWHGFIFNDVPLAEPGNKESNRINRLNYRDEYACTIKIIKPESGPESTTQRQPRTSVLEKAYPDAIDAVPLQFGSSQITKVTAQFKYERHYIIDRDIKNIKGNVSKLPTRSVVP